METQKSPFDRNLKVILVVLYLITVAGLVYPELAAETGMRKWWVIPLNVLLLSIPLVQLYGSIYVLIRGWHERSTLGAVSPRLAKVIHWAPRAAAILIIFFIGLFSLDVFEKGSPPLEILGAFLMHSIPSILLIGLLVFTWRRPVVGFVVFLIAAIAFTGFFVRGFSALSNLLLFVFPILLVAFLFYADWKSLDPSASPRRMDI